MSLLPEIGLIDLIKPNAGWVESGSARILKRLHKDISIPLVKEVVI